MTPLAVVPFEAAHIPAAGQLLASRHRTHRGAEPLLDVRFEHAQASATEVRQAFELVDASGAIGFREGKPVAFVVGSPKSATWGPNVWVEAAGMAADEPEALRDVYAAAAQRWVDEGRTAHFVVVPASDSALVDAWFRLGFGQQHAHAVREPTRSTAQPTGGVVLRRAERDDIRVLAELDLVLPQHQGLSPVFASGPVLSVEEAIAEWEEAFDDKRFANFVAEVDGRVVGSAIGCSLELSSSHVSLAVPDRAGFLGFAAVLPEARGHGVGRALGDAVIAWSADNGFSSVVTDWRVTNLLSSRAWPALGFRTTFLRLHRNIGVAG
jgi:GNAT superfamily N-acetyltransferase